MKECERDKSISKQSFSAVFSLFISYCFIPLKKEYNLLGKMYRWIFIELQSRGGNDKRIEKVNIFTKNMIFIRDIFFYLLEL